MGKPDRRLHRGQMLPQQARLPAPGADPLAAGIRRLFRSRLETNFERESTPTNRGDKSVRESLTFVGKPSPGFEPG
jgi:hypothetical protein